MIRRVEAADGPVYYASDLLASAGVPHAFSTRLGGVSPAGSPFASLNLGNPSGPIQDDWNHIHENYRRLQAAIGVAGLSRYWVHQVHGDDVAVVHHGRPFESGVKADALVGDSPAHLLAVRTADCVPILLADRPAGRVVAAVHAGWRGVIAGVVTRAVEAMEALGARRPDIVAAVGPAIGAGAFQVGPEVVAAFRATFAAADGLIRPPANADANPTIDLRGAIGLQLAAAGVSADRVDSTDLCTYSRPDEFFSHRRDGGVTGRMAALIAPAPAAAPAR